MNPKFLFIKITLVMVLFVSLAFTAKADYVVNGSASATGNDCFIITPDQYSQVGSVWYSNFMLLDYDFDFTFQVFLGYNDGGADGIAFVMQPISTGLGSSGGGLGYEGINPSIIVEYDTWQNSDPYYDHIAVQRNGDPNTSGAAVAGPVWASSTSDNIEDGLWHSTRIAWDAETTTLSVYFDGVLRLTYTNDMVNNTFGGNPSVYWGWTGATGAARNLQQVCVTSLYFAEEGKIPVPVSPWALGIAIAMILGATILRFRRSGM